MNTAADFGPVAKKGRIDNCYPYQDITCNVYASRGAEIDQETFALSQNRDVALRLPRKADDGYKEGVILDPEGDPIEIAAGYSHTGDTT